MPNRSRQKGDRHERSVVHQARAFSLRADRIRQTEQSAAGGADVWIGYKDARLELECKKRSDGFKRLYALLEEKRADAVVVGADRQPDLVVIPLDNLLAILAGCHYIPTQVAREKEER